MLAADLAVIAACTASQTTLRHLYCLVHRAFGIVGVVDRLCGSGVEVPAAALGAAVALDQAGEGVPG